MRLCHTHAQSQLANSVRLMTEEPDLQTYKRAPQSWKGPEGEQVIVDKVLVTNNDEGHMVVKVAACVLGVSGCCPVHARPLWQSRLACCGPAEMHACTC